MSRWLPSPGDRLVVLVCQDCTFEAEIERTTIGMSPWPLEPWAVVTTHHRHDATCPSIRGGGLMPTYMAVADESGEWIEDWGDW